MALIGNKVDLNHMQAVKADQHSKFATLHKMKGYYCSAKTGDQVASVYYQIASDLSGVVISKGTLDIIQKKVKAEIINHNDGIEDGETKPEDKLAAANEMENTKK